MQSGETRRRLEHLPPQFAVVSVRRQRNGGVITDGSANVLSNNLYGAFGVLMYASGSAVTHWRFAGRFVAEEGLVASAGGGGDVLAARGAELVSVHPPKKGEKVR